MAVRTLPDTEYLRECFSYDPDSGVIRWRYRPRSHFGNDHRHRQWNSRLAGRIAGRPNTFGHHMVTISWEVHYVHRIIWKIVTGSEPPELDHANRQPGDNRWLNLRIASRRNNTQNRKTRHESQTGMKGVKFDKRSRRYGASICTNGKRKWLGAYADPESAHAAYCAAAMEHFGEFWTDGR